MKNDITMKERLKKGNKITCVIETVSLNHLLVTFKTSGAVYRGVLIHEKCSTVQRYVNLSKNKVLERRGSSILKPCQAFDWHHWILLFWFFSIKYRVFIVCIPLPLGGIGTIFNAQPQMGLENFTEVMWGFPLQVGVISLMWGLRCYSHKISYRTFSQINHQ